MTQRLRAGLLAAIAGIGASGAAAAPAWSETLADAIAEAYDTNPNLQAQRASLRSVDEESVQARTGWRPTLSLQATANYQEIRTPAQALIRTGRFATREYFNSTAAQLIFSQNLWTGGRVSAQVSAANADILQSREQLRQVEEQVLVAVIQAYADVRRDQQSIAVYKQNLAILQQQLDEAQARFDVGQVTRTDVAESQVRRDSADASLQTATAQLAVSRSNYAALVGHNPGDLAPEPSLAFLMPGNPDDAFEVAERNNPALRAQEFAEEASRSRIAYARAQRWPQLQLQSTMSYGNAPLVPFNQGLFDREWTTTVGLTVPLFTGGLTSSQVRQAIERNNTDRITIETQRRNVLQTITQNWNQIVALRTNMITVEREVRAAQVAQEGASQEYKLGLRSTYDVLNAAQELVSAQLGQLAVHHDEYVVSANLLAAMGRLEARNLIPSQPQYDPKANYRHLRITWGWVPWEEPIAVFDRYVTYPTIPNPKEMHREAPIGPGLQPQPDRTPQKPSR